MNSGESPNSPVVQLIDVSDRPCWLLKGLHAEEWLSKRRVAIPATTLASILTSDQARVTRTGSDEFLVDSPSGRYSQLQHTLTTEQFDATDLLVHRQQDAAFLLRGQRARDVMAQTCGINFAEVPADQLIMTRVAGVSCGVRMYEQDETICYEIRLDPTYGIYLWEELQTICQELGGGAAK